MNDMVNHPEHYADTTSIECIEAMEIAFGTEAVKDFCRCNAFKYLWRHKNKNNKEKDLEKADWYMNYLLGLETGYRSEQDLALIRMIERYIEKGGE